MNEINPDDIKTLLGDRVLVEVLPPPQKIGLLHVPESVENKKGHRSIYWARIVKFGLDSKAEGKTSEDAPAELSEGDIVGIEPLARDCVAFTGSNGKEYQWVPDEFLAVKDNGDVARLYVS